MFEIKKYFDSANPNSKANNFRKKRFDLFLELFDDIIKNQTRVDILDVGGWEIFWKNMGIEKYPNVHILLLNIDKQQTTLPNICSTVGDGCDMNWLSYSKFDIVFSNSVIEHVGDFDRQKQFAKEVKRIGKRYFVQTPNFFFPIEPHFMFFGFHWLTRSMRIFLLTHFNLGWYKKFNDKEKAQKLVDEIRLLKLNELKRLFPNGQVYKEKYFGLNKSFIVTN